jgi:hypothetical protein
MPVDPSLRFSVLVGKRSVADTRRQFVDASCALRKRGYCLNREDLDGNLFGRQ